MSEHNDAKPSREDNSTILYLTHLMCVECEGATKIAHEAPWVQLDQDPQWPDVDYCAKCGAAYPEDLGVSVIEVQEAEVVPPTEEKP